MNIMNILYLALFTYTSQYKVLVIVFFVHETFTYDSVSSANRRQPPLTLKVLVATIDALGHLETESLQHSVRGWGR